ncbi:carbohydrate porin [Cronobacter sakazakii]
MKKMMVLPCVFSLLAPCAMAEIKMNTPQGDLKFYGDVEFNVDAASRTGQLTSLRTSDDKDWKPGDHEKWDVNGRILLGVDGYREKNGNFAGFTVQPLADLSGHTNLDDAAFYFGQPQAWKIKVGRFEAYDMFPLNQDTFIQYSGNTANDIYGDGFGYVYMMKEGRGRSSNGGAVQFSGEYGNWYFELNNMVKDGTTLFADDTYHGNALENKKNVIYMRPVVAWRDDHFSAAVAMETNVVSNAYGYNDAQGRFQDQSDHTGYGATFTWNSLKNDPDDGTVININTAYMDADDETDFSAGANMLWRHLELGYIYAHNNIDDFNMSSVGEEDGQLKYPGKYDIHTVHLSYGFTNVMDMDNFNIYLGAYWSQLSLKESDYDNEGDKDRYGARVRFKYFF